MSWIENAKERAAKKALDHVEDGMILGLGSGSTVSHAVRLIGLKRGRGELKDLKCIPTSTQIAEEAINVGIKLTTLDEYPTIELSIDGADQIDPNLNAIKGGGGALLREKVVATASKEYIIIADERKKADILGYKQAVPIEINPFSTNIVIKRVEEMGGVVELRKGTGKLGPTITDNGNYIIDANFGKILNPLNLDRRLHAIPGLLETGLFLGYAERAYLGTREKVAMLTKKGQERIG
jgi:ribose 5-phosphate isomerase A